MVAVLRPAAVRRRAADRSVFCTSSRALQAGLGEGVGLEDEVEPGDVVAVGGGGGLSADIPRLGRQADRLAGEPIEEPAIGPRQPAACPAAE